MRSIDRDFLVANIAQVGRLAEQANQYGDAVGQFQLARRKQELDAELAALSTPRRHPLIAAWKCFLVLCLALTILGLQGCAEVAAFRSGVAEHGADAADQALETAIWTMCNASPVGAVKRRFKTEAEIDAYNTICPDYFGVDAATGLPGLPD